MASDVGNRLKHSLGILMNKQNSSSLEGQAVAILESVENEPYAYPSSHFHNEKDNACVALVIGANRAKVLAYKGLYFNEYIGELGLQVGDGMELVIPTEVSDRPGYWTMRQGKVTTRPDRTEFMSGEWTPSSYDDLIHFGVDVPLALSAKEPGSWGKLAARSVQARIKSEVQAQSLAESLYRFVHIQASSSELFKLITTFFHESEKMRSAGKSESVRLSDQILRNPVVKELVTRLAVPYDKRLERLTEVVKEELGSSISVNDNTIRRILHFLDFGVECPSSAITLYVDLEHCAYRGLHDAYVKKFGPLDPNVTANDIDGHIRSLIEEADLQGD